MTMSVSAIEESPKENGIADTMGVTAPVPNKQDAIIGELRRNVEIIDIAVSTKDSRLQSRILRQNRLIRRRLTPAALTAVVKKYLSKDQMSFFAKYLLDNGELAEVEMSSDKKTAESTAPATIPEICAYLQLLGVIMLIDSRRNEEAVEASTALVEYVTTYRSRTMDDISSRAFYFYVRAYEMTDKMSSIRSRLLSAYRTSVLRHDHVGQAMLLNLLLRNYIHYNLYDQADKLVTRTQFPETRSNNQLARYMYFNGRIKAIQLDYSEALDCLQQALRKAPQGTALGFRTIVQKFIFIVQLLTGEIPDRAAFRQSSMERALRPYLDLTKSVRIGDLNQFREVVDQNQDVFSRDQTMTLITRLRQNVIKTGLRKINTSYSRISLEDICTRLGLDSKEETEGVVAKAIRDGVIDAVIDPKTSAVQSRDNVNTYTTVEPANAYHNRLEFCLNIYSEAIRAMRFPDATEDDANAEARRERLKEEQELAKTLEEDEEDLEDDY